MSDRYGRKQNPHHSQSTPDSATSRGDSDSDRDSSGTSWGAPPAPQPSNRFSPSDGQGTGATARGFSRGNSHLPDRSPTFPGGTEMASSLGVLSANQNSAMLTNVNPSNFKSSMLGAGPTAGAGPGQLGRGHFSSKSMMPSSSAGVGRPGGASEMPRPNIKREHKNIEDSPDVEPVATHTRSSNKRSRVTSCSRKFSAEDDASDHSSEPPSDAPIDRNSPSRAGGTQRRASSRYRGVCWLKKRKAWRARIEIDGVRKHLGYFNDEVAAARAYDARARETLGLSARLNFPDEEEREAAAAASRASATSTATPPGSNFQHNASRLLMGTRQSSSSSSPADVNSDASSGLSLVRDTSFGTPPLRSIAQQRTFSGSSAPQRPLSSASFREMENSRVQQQQFSHISQLANNPSSVAVGASPLADSPGAVQHALQQFLLGIYQQQNPQLQQQMHESQIPTLQELASLNVNSGSQMRSQYLFPTLFRTQQPGAALDSNSNSSTTGPMSSSAYPSLSSEQGSLSVPARTASGTPPLSSATPSSASRSVDDFIRDLARHDVTYDSQTGRYAVHPIRQNRRIYLGSYDTREEALQASATCARLLLAEYADQSSHAPTQVPFNNHTQQPFEAAAMEQQQQLQHIRLPTQISGQPFNFSNPSLATSFAHIMNQFRDVQTQQQQQQQQQQSLAHKQVKREPRDH